MFVLPGGAEVVEVNAVVSVLGIGSHNPELLVGSFIQ